MNSPTSSPRLSCRLVRSWSALTSGDGSAAPTGAASRHVESCPDCQEYFGAADEFDAALRAEARAYRVAAPGLEQKVIRAVRNAQPESSTPTRSGNWLPVYAGAAAALLVGVFVFNNTRTARETQVAEVSPEEIRTVLAAAQNASNQLWENVAPAATALAENDPLQRQIDSVYTDARQAMSFLAANFLPNGGTARGNANEEAGMTNG